MAMDTNKKDETQKPGTPAAVPDDVQQLTRWASEYGRPALIGLGLAVVILLGLTIWRNQQAEKAQAAVQALFEPRAPEEFQQMAFASPDAPTAPLALATAASEFYSLGRYDEALSAYQRFVSQYSTHMLAPEAEMGVAASLEALDDFVGAAERYEAFMAAHPGSPLVAQAVMGAARCREQIGQYEEARMLYEDYIAANPESTWLPQIESGLLFLEKAERARQAQAAAPAAEPEVVFDLGVDEVVLEEVEGVEPEADAMEEPVEAPMEGDAAEEAEAAPAAEAVDEVPAADVVGDSDAKESEEAVQEETPEESADVSGSEETAAGAPQEE